MANGQTNLERDERDALLRESEERLAAELRGTELLRDLAERLVPEESSRTFYEEILSAAMAITRSDAGTVQLYEPETRSLVLLVTSGFSNAMTDHFQRVDADSHTACGVALRTGERTFVDFDAETDEACRMHVEAGYRSAQATPLLSREGEPLGMLNTHWCDSRHRPDERELRFLDLLARQAADLIEARHTREVLREQKTQLTLALDIGETGHWTYDLSSGELISSAHCRSNFGRSTELPFSYEELIAAIHLDDRARQQRAIEDAATMRADFEVEYRIVTPQRQLRWIHVQGRFADGSRPRLLGVSRDVTVRRLAEERQAFLLELSDALRPLTDAIEVQRIAARIVGAYFGALRAGFGEVDGAEIVVHADHADGAGSLAGRYPCDAFGPMLADVYRHGGIAVVRNIDADPDLTEADRAPLRAVGVAAHATVAIRKAGRPALSFGIQSDVPRDWTDAELALVCDIADRVWTAVARARAEAALRESEERQAFLLGMGDAMRAAPSADALIAIAARRLGKELGASRIVFAEIDDDAGIANIRTGWTADGAETHPATLKLSDFGGPLLDDLRAGRIVRYDDVGDPPYARPDLAALSAIGIKAGLSVPLLVGGRFVVNLNVHQHEPRVWTDAEVALVTEVAERIWAAVERARAEEALAESEEKYRTLFDTIEEGFCIIERVPGDPADFRYLTANPAFERHSGLRDPVGKTMRELVPGVEEAIVARYESVAVTGKPEAFKSHVAELDRWFEVEANAIDLPNQIAVLFRDVTDAKQAERRLRESEERQAFLLKLSDALRPLEKLADIKAASSRMVGEHFGVERAAYAEFSPDQATIFTEGGWRRPGVSSVDGTYGVEDAGEFTATLLRGEVAVMRDAHSDPSVTPAIRTGMWDALGARAALAVPLFKHGQVAAALYAHSVPPRDWTAAEIALLADIAERTWAAVERARAEDALRESEERFRTLTNAAPALIWENDASGGNVFINQYCIDYTGLTFEQFRGLGWHAILHPEDAKVYVDTYLEAVAARDAWTGRARIRRYDGTYRWFAGYGVPLIGDHGQYRGHLGVTIDISDTVSAEAALRESEERLRQFGEASQDVLWIRDAQSLQWQYLTPAFEAIYGLSREEALAGENYRNWLDLIVPEDRDQAKANIERVRAGEHVTFEFRIRRPRDGAVRWMRNTDFPIYAENGRVALIGGIGHDTTDLKRSVERQATLLAELQHRVRNILAVTRSIISRSDDGERSTEDYVNHLQGRIAALARTQVLLTRAAGTTIDLDSLIRDELLAQVASFHQVTIDGPDVALSPKVAEVLTLALHELATNATKYGAFSKIGGQLEVRWRIETREDQDWLILDWQEHNVPIIDAAPRRRGFGAELISRRIPYELKGSGTLELKPGGVASHIEFPLVAGDSILQTDAGGR